jgi:DDE superfamily endonuclease
MGLKPIMSRVWSKRGQRPIALQKRGYEWLHTYSFVQPGNGQAEFWVMSQVDTPTMNLVLHQFCQSVNPTQQKIIVLLWDNAGWHIAHDLEVPPGLHLYPLLPYSPELSPAEPLMPLLHECLANQLLTTLQDVQDRLVKRCLYLQSQPPIIKGACRFNWTIL